MTIDDVSHRIGGIEATLITQDRMLDEIRTHCGDIKDMLTAQNGRIGKLEDFTKNEVVTKNSVLKVACLFAGSVAGGAGFSGAWAAIKTYLGIGQ